ncbi:SAICAR synthase-like protein [Leucogyrophana mollusca]|uniref:SAICAR synthase-like protein n=1 Tax=Leucogyrophana mollusca TaxID=85980 RepID=A0ACB8B4T0_9AGAM|nr:SAICAR synthase-like protein [Leucogyrophana mollusca]
MALSSPSNLPPTVPLASQVGGHAGVQTTEDNSLLLKPALPQEIAFYQQIASDPTLSRLKQWTCKFLGTLQLHGTVKEGAGEGMPLEITPLDGVAENKDQYNDHHCLRSISLTDLLENLTHGFIKPNILDVKLGTVFCDESAPPEKRARMELEARETTSAETGVRLTGFQVHSNGAPGPVITSKAYGKGITASQLPEGIARFFPVSAEQTQLGLPANFLLPILVRLHKDIGRIKVTLEEIEMRLVGASLLIIYEGDWATTGSVEETWNAAGERVLEDEEDDADAEGVEDMETVNDDNSASDDEDSDDDEEGPGPVYIVKLIDFAHTRLTPGLGPDKGVILGLRTVLGLLSERIKEVRELIASN